MHLTKHATYIIPFYPHNNPPNIIIPILQKRKLSHREVQKIDKGSHLEGNRAKIWNQVCFIPVFTLNYQDYP